MSNREERVALNEAAARDINEKIEDAQAEGLKDRFLRIVCECGDAHCERVIAITQGEYEAVRSDPRRFVIIEEHVLAEVEVIVDKTDRFVVVEKRDGAPAEVAEAEDPRT
jgi:5-bromo-4-chloroindolyl phosphate hydrolysis protein